MRALVVSNMLPDPAHPERGRFVRDQVRALRELEGLSVSLYEFAPGPRALVQAGAELRRRFAGERFDLVHAHFGLTAWPALAVRTRARALTIHGSDATHPRTRLLTLAALPLIELPAVVSQELLSRLPRRFSQRARVLPCGADLERFRAMPRAQARAQLGLPADGSYMLFPADPARSEKRHDRALALAEATGATLLHLGGVDPEQVPAWVNAANVVVVPSEREGFGLAAIEALACDVPVLATPVGIHAQALRDVRGALCAEFDLASWARAAGERLGEQDPRVAGRESARRFSSVPMAEAVRDAWAEVLARSR